MLKMTEGNILDTDAEAVVNTVNTVGVMGKGIALQFKQAYPGNYKAYRAACQRGDVSLGHMFVFDTGRMGPADTSSTSQPRATGSLDRGWRTSKLAFETWFGSSVTTGFTRSRCRRSDAATGA